MKKYERPHIKNNNPLLLKTNDIYHRYARSVCNDKLPFFERSIRIIGFLVKQLKATSLLKSASKKRIDIENMSAKFDSLQLVYNPSVAQSSICSYQSVLFCDKYR